MIERYQELLLEFTDRTLPEFWNMTESETVFNIKIGQKKRQTEIDFQIELQAQLMVSVMNAPFGPWLKGKDYPFKYAPSKTHAGKHEISEKEKANKWMAAGNAMMKTARMHEQNVKQCRR